MAVFAIALYVVFVVLGFGWRSWVQYRRTGSSGFRGVRGRLGSLEWLAGAGFVVALIAGPAAPVLQLAGAVSPVSVLQLPWLQGAGTVRPPPWCDTACSGGSATPSSPPCWPLLPASP